MKKLKLVIGTIIGLTIFSCSSDDSSPNNIPDLNDKKLIKVTEENRYGVYVRQFIYDLDNKVIQIEGSFTEEGQTTSDLYSEVFTYENNLITSSIINENGALYRTFDFIYSNGRLSERIVYISDGTEDERLMFSYNSNNEVESYNYYVESSLQQSQNFTYNSNKNVISADDSVDTSEIQYDTKLSPSNNFTDSNRIIFGVEQLFMNLSKNNETSRTTTYNYPYPSASTLLFETSILYDADNYPISKIVTETNTASGNQRNIRTLTFEYE